MARQSRRTPMGRPSAPLPPAELRSRRAKLAAFALAAAAGGMLLTALAARAEDTHHDIAWYMANPRVRAATLNLCRSDHRFQFDADCANAETAENRLWAQRAGAGAGAGAGPNRNRIPTPGELLTSPEDWAANPLARVGVLAACRNPSTGYRPDECAAARRGEALAGAQGRGDGSARGR